MDLEAPVEINIKELRKEYEKALKEGKEFLEYKELKFYINYVKYLLEYVEGKGKESFRVSKSSLPE